MPNLPHCCPMFSISDICIVSAFWNWWLFTSATATKVEQWTYFNTFVAFAKNTSLESRLHWSACGENVITVINAHSRPQPWLVLVKCTDFCPAHYWAFVYKNSALLRSGRVSACICATVLHTERDGCRWLLGSIWAQPLSLLGRLLSLCRCCHVCSPCIVCKATLHTSHNNKFTETFWHVTLPITFNNKTRSQRCIFLQNLVVRIDLHSLTLLKRLIMRSVPLTQHFGDYGKTRLLCISLWDWRCLQCAWELVLTNSVLPVLSILPIYISSNMINTSERTIIPWTVICFL